MLVRSVQPWLPKMSPEARKLQFEALLAREGGLYTFDDVMEHLEDGRFQSFAHNDTWVITQIQDFPRKRVLHVQYILGTLEDFYVIEKELVDFATKLGANYMSGAGRMGWKKKAPEGWRATALILTKEIAA